jgi:hypothetical protein
MCGVYCSAHYSYRLIGYDGDATIRPDCGNSDGEPPLPRDFECVKRVFGKEPVAHEGMTEIGMISPIP